MTIMIIASSGITVELHLIFLKLSLLIETQEDLSYQIFLI
ncbi:hypothetical protein ExPECSC022_02941 [Escherichia coli]|nr:hypothetical protein ExPECSC022_02941 [Escherichia coli]